MPTTINGIGTHYYFKKNLVSQSGFCDSCHSQAILSDYETGLWFCVIFIPVIPLGRKMIIGECNLCAMHRVMPLKEWEVAKEAAIGQSLESLSESSADPKAALELLGTYTAFNQFDEANQLATAISASHPDDYDVQMALAAWHERRGNQSDADEGFARVLRIDFDRPESKRIRIFDHIQQGQFAEAKLLAIELYAWDKDETQPVVLLVSFALQKASLHADAHQIHKMLLDGHPALNEDKDFRVAVRKSEKAIGKTDSIVPKKKMGIFN